MFRDLYQTYYMLWDCEVMSVLRFCAPWTVRASSVDSPNLFTSEHEYVTFGAATNTTHYARALPPIHRNCPTPMGVAGWWTILCQQILIILYLYAGWIKVHNYTRKYQVLALTEMFVYGIIIVPVNQVLM